MQEFAADLLNDFNNCELPLTRALLMCDQSYFIALRDAVQDLASGLTGEKRITEIHTITAASYEKMRNSSSSTELAIWRRMYTDSSIVKALIEVAISASAQAISTLDYAIIVAGAAGEGRLDLIHRLVKKIQFAFWPGPCQAVAPSGSISTLSSVHILSTAKHAIPEISTPPSLLSFQSENSRHPFILRNYADKWPAMTNHPWRSSRYLRAVAGPGRVVPVEVGNNYLADDWKQVIMKWDDFLSSLELEDQPLPCRSDEVLYLAQHDLFMQFPTLRGDIVIPDYAFASLSYTDHSCYRPPSNDDHILLNAWLGPKATVSPAHTDPYHNLYVQLVGRKTVWLAPPSVSQHMSRHRNTDQVMEENAAKTMTSNTSDADVFSDGSCKSSFPTFWSQVVPTAMSATLKPGDLLFFPAGWWHAMRSEDTSFSMSIWF